MIPIKLPEGDLYEASYTDEHGTKWTVTAYFERPEVTARRFQENFVQYVALRPTNDGP